MYERKCNFLPSFLVCVFSMDARRHEFERVGWRRRGERKIAPPRTKRQTMSLAAALETVTLAVQLDGAGRLAQALEAYERAIAELTAVANGARGARGAPVRDSRVCVCVCVCACVRAPQRRRRAHVVRCRYVKRFVCLFRAQTFFSCVCVSVR